MIDIGGEVRSIDPSVDGKKPFWLIEEKKEGSDFFFYIIRYILYLKNFAMSITYMRDFFGDEFRKISFLIIKIN